MKKLIYKLSLGLGVVIGAVYIVYSAFFLTVNRTGSAVLQLEDSDTLYSLGQRVATGGGLFSFLWAISVILVIYGLWGLLKKRN